MIINEEGIFDRMTYGIFNKNNDRGFLKWSYIKDAYLKVNQTYYQGLSTNHQL